MVNPMNEQFLIDQIILYLGQHQRFGGKYNETMAYKRLEQLRALVGLKDAKELLQFLNRAKTLTNELEETLVLITIPSIYYLKHRRVLLQIVY